MNKYSIDFKWEDLIMNENKKQNEETIESLIFKEQDKDMKKLIYEP